jgi:hypothetical protein
MRRSSPSTLVLARVTLKQLDRAALGAVLGGQLRMPQASYADSCYQLSNCSTDPRQFPENA